MSNSRRWLDRKTHRLVAIGIVGLLTLAGLLFVVFSDDDAADVLDVGTPAPTRDADAAPHAPVVTGVATPPVEASPPPDASPVASPQPIAETACARGCLIRIPANNATSDVLEKTGERPSYRSDDWLWTIVDRETVDQLLTASLPVYLVQDSRETLYLYATRLPEDGSGSGAVVEFGEILDSIDGHSIVRVESVPAYVTEVIDARVWVEKLIPAVPEGGKMSPAGNGESISGIDLGVLLPEVDAGEIERTVAELQGMSSTDGTGIGTRHYTTTGNVMAAEYVFSRMESYGLTVWYEDFVTPEGLLSVNIIGEIPGRDSSSVYGVMAHIDSISTDLSSAPGADDNAPGMAASLEIARILSGYELRHPVHIIMVNAEETAIIGSMAYARNAIQEGVPLEGVFNADAVGSPANGPRIVLNADEGSAWMMDLLVRINDGYGLGQDILVRQNPAIVADDTMLRNEGIESVMVTREVFGAASVHHTSEDVMENMSIPYTVQMTQLLLLALAALVQ